MSSAWPSAARALVVATAGAAAVVIGAVCADLSAEALGNSQGEGGWFGVERRRAPVVSESRAEYDGRYSFGISGRKHHSGLTSRRLSQNRETLESELVDDRLEVSHTGFC